MTELALQILLAVLLGLTITWCVIVHSRLRRFRLERAELQQLIDALTLAADRAEAAVASLKTTGAEVGGTFNREARQASLLIQELRRLNGTAAPRPAPAPEPAPKRPAAPTTATVTPGLKAELMEALASLG